MLDLCTKAIKTSNGQGALKLEGVEEERQKMISERQPGYGSYKLF